MPDNAVTCKEAPPVLPVKIARAPRLSEAEATPARRAGRWRSARWPSRPKFPPASELPRYRRARLRC